MLLTLKLLLAPVVTRLDLKNIVDVAVVGVKTGDPLVWSFSRRLFGAKLSYRDGYSLGMFLEAVVMRLWVMDCAKGVTAQVA